MFVKTRKWYGRHWFRTPHGWGSYPPTKAGVGLKVERDPLTGKWDGYYRPPGKEWRRGSRGRTHWDAMKRLVE